MIISKEADEIDFVVVNRKMTEKDHAEFSQAIAEYIALRDSLRAQGYSPEEVEGRLNARFADETRPKKPRRPKKPAAAPSARRSDSAVLTA